MSRPPLREQLASTTDEARISRMWSAIRERREVPRRRPVAALALAAAALLAVAGGFASLWPEARPGELRLASGELPAVIEADSQAEAAVSLEDGSRIELEPGARLETIENGGDRFATLLARGTARFSVQPGGPRRWVVESGLATIEVIGTVFRVDRRTDGVEVQVERGIVLVRGERVPDRVRRLTAGQSVFVPSAEVVAANSPAGVPANGPTDVPLPVELAQRDADSPTPTPPTTPPTNGTSPTVGVASSLSSPERAGATRDPVEVALERADAARRRGQPAQAVAHLRRAVGAEGDPRAALAAFTIGRIELDELHRPDAARAAFQRALALGLPEHLAAQARRRIDELTEAAP